MIVGFMRRHAMQHAAIAGLLATLGLAPAARADFVVTGAIPPAPTTHSPSVHGAVPAPETSQTQDAARPVRWLMARGFGRHVTLRFAAEQIIPKAVKVTYGPGADPDALVDWKGGEAWNDVLRDAVEPLGLHLVMSNMAVEIRK
jgi:hypothetical protein